MSTKDRTSSSLPLALVASVAGAVGVTGCVFHYRRKWQASQRRPPPAPASTLETVQAIAGPNAPWFLLDLARGMNVPVFRLPIPMPLAGVYVITTAKLQRQVLSDKDAEKPSFIYRAFAAPGYPEGIFTRKTSDPIWKSVRKGTAHAFSKNEVGRMNAICARRVNNWIEERLERFIERNETFDPSHEMIFMTFSTIMEAAFEYEATYEEFNQYTKNAETFLVEFGFRHIANPFRRCLGWFFSGYRQAMHAANENFSFLKRVLDAYRSNPKKSDSNTLIKLILQATDTESQALSEMGTFIAGGFDTTGFTLSTTLVLLAKHPEIVAKAREEQRKVGPSQITEYLRCIIKESRRFLSVAAMGASRQYSVPVKLGPYQIPAGAALFMPQILPHRDANVYAPDPDTFRPERWLKATDDMNESLVSFAVGPRNCIGQSLAIAELESVLPRLLLAYDFTLEEEGKLEYFLTLKFRGSRLNATKI
eukprot:scaffold2917_cov191-Amphora_coffeaeformis.AAC.54